VKRASFALAAFVVIALTFDKEPAPTADCPFGPQGLGKL
jgi:hypothetical protein